jgi:hypothetical protein
MALELEEAGGFAVDETFPDEDVGTGEMRSEAFVGPLHAISPVPLFAHVVIEPAIVIDGDSVTMHEAHAGISVRWS